MSISYEIKNKILKLPLKGAKKTVLLAFSDFADRDGGSIFPSFETVATHIGATREWVTKIVSSLCIDGWIRKLTNYKNRPNLYCIEVQNIKEYQDEVLTQFTPLCSEFTVNNENHCELNSHHCELNSHHCELNSHKRSYNYQLTYNTYVQKVNFSEKTEPIQKLETPSLEEQIIVKPEKPVEAKKTSQPALPIPIVEAEKKPPKVKSGKTPKSRINPEMELTPERIQVALDHGLHSSWIETEFNAFKKHYVENGKIRPGWDASWNSWAERAATIYNPNGMKSKPHPVKPSISLEMSATTLSPPVVQVVEDENLNKFLENNPNLDGRFAFSGATMRKIGDEITICHPSQFSLDKMEIHSYKLKEFFKVSKIDFTTETVKKPVLVSPPKVSVNTPPPESVTTPDSDIQPLGVTEIKPPRYRTLNDSYQGSTSQSLGASLNALQRSYQQKLQTTG